MLAHLLTMIDGVPPHLLTLDASAAAELGESVEAIRMALAAWRTGSHHIVLSPLVGTNSWSPLTFIRKHFSALPDEGAAAELLDLEFIADETLRRSLATDLHSINAALDRGAWKSATVLAGSLAEAFLLDALLKRQTDAIAAGARLSPPASADLSSWTLHQLTEVADALRAIHKETASLCRVAKNFRNLIHPGRSIRLGQVCDRGTALAGVATVEHVIRDLRSGHG